MCELVTHWRAIWLMGLQNVEALRGRGINCVGDGEVPAGGQNIGGYGRPLADGQKRIRAHEGRIRSGAGPGRVNHQIRAGKIEANDDRRRWRQGNAEERAVTIRAAKSGRPI